MGAKLVKYYDDAKALGDLKAQMRLAVLTKMSVQKAEAEPDSPENVNLFEKAMQELKKEF